MTKTKNHSGTERKQPSFETHEDRWRAVVQKDVRGDGRFWYSVKTTGIYCRPSCPSRRPNRQNVSFHDTIRDAENAGFRACKRCDPKGSGLASRHAEAVASACRLVEEADSVPNLETLARAVRLSPGYFHRLFKATTGLTPKDYANAHRSARIRNALPKRETVTEALYEAGYNSNGRFYAVSTQVLGMKPSEYRAGGEKNIIRFALGESSLGSVLVAATQKGICAIMLGSDPARLKQDLHHQFPKAEIMRGDDGFENTMAKVVRFVDSPNVGLPLPLDIRGTAFQCRVWKELQRIPLGETLSYSELAQRIGSPKSTRAVAQACGANTIAVAIPCHRVVRTNGDISGYRWGVARKKKLLAAEKDQARKDSK